MIFLDYLSRTKSKPNFLWAVEDITFLFNDIIIGNLDLPIIDQKGNYPVIWFGGWVYHKEITIKRLDIIQDNTEIKSIDLHDRKDVANNNNNNMLKSGFLFFLYISDFLFHQKLFINAILENELKITILEIKIKSFFSHATSYLNIKSKIPTLVVINTTGRTGSSLLMQSLITHPQISGINCHPYENRFIQDMAMRLRLNLWMMNDLTIRDFGFFDSTFIETTIYRFLEHNYIDQLMNYHLFSSLNQFYNNIAYFKKIMQLKNIIIEKSQTGFDHNFSRWIFPQYKEIMLVRDLRDVVISQIAFDKQRNNNMFTYNITDTPELYFSELKKFNRHLLKNYNDHPDDCLIIRYEDLITETEKTLSDILNYIEVSNKYIKNMINNMFLVLHTHHMTSKNISSSVKRWEKEFPEQYSEYYKIYLKEINQQLGYDS